MTGKKKTGRSPTHNWNQWKMRFARACEVDKKTTLKGYCDANALNYETAKRYIKVRDNKKLIKNIEHDMKAIDIFCEKLRTETDETKHREYLKALRQSLMILEDVMVEAFREFRRGIAAGGSLTPGEAGRLALDAAERLRKVAMEMQGIPKDDDDFGWPLTKKFWPHWYQRDFIFDFPSTLEKQGKEKFIFAFIGGIRSGKTLCGAQKFGELAWRNRGCTLAVYAPTYRMLEDSTKAVFLEVLTKKGISFVYRKSENSILLFGDTTILFRSMDDPEHLRGTTLAGAWIDEGGQMKTAEAFKVIEGRVSDPEASELCIVVTTTPDGLGWLYDVIVEEGEQRKVIQYHARTEWNYTLPEGYVERLTGSYDERFGKQELGGEWIDVFAGQAYWNFTRSIHVLDHEKKKWYRKDLPLLLMFDLNVDPMCWNVGHKFVDGNQHKTVIFDEIHIRSAATSHAAKEFVKRYAGHKAGVTIYGDATCRHRSTKTTRTDYDVIEKTLKTVGGMPNVQIRIGPHNPRVTDRIASVNAQLLDMKGVPKLFILKRCKYTTRDFQKVAFKSGTRELNKDDPSLTHHSDAIGYYIAKMFPVRGVQVSTR